MKRLLTFVCLFLCVPSAQAQHAGSDTLSFELPQLTVTASRSAVTPAEAPMRVTVLDSAELARTGAPSVSELLSRRAGGFVKQSGSTGLATLSLRGTGSSQSLFLLDGHRIENPQLGQLDLSLLPTLLVESVEIMHGSGSALYGSNPFGGVVNVRTLEQSQNETVRAETVYGAYGERGASLLAAGSSGRLSAVAAGEVTSTNGNFPYMNEALFPPRTVRRTGADRERASLFSAIEYETRRAGYQVNAWYNEAERGLPGVSTTESRDERQWDEQLRFWGDAEFDRSWGTLSIGSLVQTLDVRYLNPASSIDQTGETLSASANAGATTTAGDRWLLSGGVTLQHRQAIHPQLSDRTNEQSGAIFASGTGRYGRLLVYPIIRADAYFLARGRSGPAVAATPQLGLNLQPFSAYNIRLKSNVGRSFRMPTLNDRYWLPGGNPNLKPEQGWTVETGVAVPGGRHRAEVTSFITWIDHQITWQATDAGHWRPFNVARTRSIGIEASYRLRMSPSPTSSVYGGLFYTFTDARDRSDPAASSYDRQVRYVPRHQVKASLGFGWKSLYLGTNVRGVSRRYVTTSGRQYLSPYFVTDTYIRTSIDFGVLSSRLGLYVDNIFDENYSVVRYYPMPPRHGRITLTLEWNAP